jgi:hypothetical protein
VLHGWDLSVTGMYNVLSVIMVITNSTTTVSKFCIHNLFAGISTCSTVQIILSI